MYDNLKQLTEEYFYNFEKKDINKLEEMFDDNIILFDPIVKEVIGKNAVLDINKNIFSDCKEIRFTKKELFIDEGKLTIIGEVEFYCANTKINVVDIIRFNKDLKIVSIVAYLDTGIFND